MTLQHGNGRGISPVPRSSGDDAASIGAGRGSGSEVDPLMFRRYISDMLTPHQHVVGGSNGNGVLKRDLAYDAISTAIIRLELAPLSLIDEAALCAQLGLGRTPVREALQRLMHEGLVTIYPRRGAIVTPITLLDAEHLTQARLIWEPGIARLAAAVGTAAHWDA